MRRPAYFVVLKKLSFLAFVLFLLNALGGCQPGGVAPPATGSARSMKGFELYSWQMQGKWYFALVPGTNRIKTYQEVTSSEVRVEGLEALKRELDQLAGGEQVFWLEGRVPNTALPPDDVIREVRAYCQQRGIRLEVQTGVSFFEPPLPTQTGPAVQATQTVPAALTPAASPNANWVTYPSLNEVRSLAFAPDGALWAATDGAVHRFDGTAWVTMTECGQDLPAGNILDIGFAPDGAAWVATGFTLARFDGASWTRYDRLANSLAVASDGAIWVNGWEGRQGSQYVARFDGRSWTTYQSTDSYPGGFIVGAVTADGLVWGVDSERRLACFDGRSWADGQSWTFYGTADGLPSDRIVDLVVAPDDVLWAITDAGIAYLDGGVWESIPLDDTLGTINAMAFAPDGSVWLATSRGAVHLRSWGIP